jgi:K+-sensing histidine kinase KdpD
MGLGLAVARRPRAQRGAIDAANRNDGGATIVVTLPLVPA